MENMKEMSGYIEDLNEKAAVPYIGSVVLIVLIIIVGVVGNLHVFLVYLLRMKPSTHRIFILFIAVVDFLSCVIAMPFIIHDLRNPLTYYAQMTCKFLKFMLYSTCCSSALTLLVIAIDRYRKICKPFGRQVTPKIAKILCIIVITVALLISWPAFILNEVVTVDTSHPDVYGSKCATDHKEQFGSFSQFFSTTLITVSTTSLLILSFVYVLIWREVSKHNLNQKDSKRILPGAISVLNVTTTGFSTTEIPRHNSLLRKASKVSRLKDDDTSNDNSELSNNNDADAISVINMSKNETLQRQTKKKAKSYNRAKKKTLIFLVVTVVFFLGYMLHFTLKKIKSTHEGFVESLSLEEQIVFNTFFWLFLINHSANCFIYGFLDERFRFELRRMYKQLFCQPKCTRVEETVV